VSHEPFTTLRRAPVRGQAQAGIPRHAFLARSSARTRNHAVTGWRRLGVAEGLPAKLRGATGSRWHVEMAVAPFRLCRAETWNGSRRSQAVPTGGSPAGRPPMSRSRYRFVGRAARRRLGSAKPGQDRPGQPAASRAPADAGLSSGARPVQLAVPAPGSHGDASVLGDSFGAASQHPSAAVRAVQRPGGDSRKAAKMDAKCVTKGAAYRKHLRPLGSTQPGVRPTRIVAAVAGPTGARESLRGVDLEPVD
jgi:hypothetical protein